MLQDATKVKRPLLMAMSMVDSSAARLAALARAPNATFEVTGQKETSGDGTEYFSPGACTFIYRLPN